MVLGFIINLAEILKRLDVTLIKSRRERREQQTPILPEQYTPQREVSFWRPLRISEITVVQQPFVLSSPAYLVAKLRPNFSIIFPGSPQTLIDALLHAKAEAPIAVFYPKLVNGTQVLAGEFFNK